MRTREAAILGVLLALGAIEGPSRMPRLRIRDSRTNCASCHADIPPGKAGRKCKKCWKGEPCGR